MDIRKLQEKKSAGRGKEISKEENYAYNLELATRERQRVREERGGGRIGHSPA
jgi:hypothetical protein